MGQPVILECSAKQFDSFRLAECFSKHGQNSLGWFVDGD